MLDAVGGTTATAMLAMLRAGGYCISYGPASLPGATARMTGVPIVPAQTNLQWQGFNLFDVLQTMSAAEGMKRLLTMVAGNVILPQVEVETSWTDVATVVARLLDRSFVGKAVLHL